MWELPVILRPRHLFSSSCGLPPVLVILRLPQAERRIHEHQPTQAFTVPLASEERPLALKYMYDTIRI